MAQSTTIMNRIDTIDRKISSFFHGTILKPQILEFIILPFAYLFSPFFVPVLILIVGFKIPTSIDADGVLGT